MKPDHYPYECPECDGSGREECDCCGSSVPCTECEGSGLDFEKVDVPRWQEALSTFIVETDVSWSWIEGGEYRGHISQDGKKKLAIVEVLRTGRSA